MCVQKVKCTHLVVLKCASNVKAKRGRANTKAPSTVPVLLEQYGMDSANYDRSTWYAITKNGSMEQHGENMT